MCTISDYSNIYTWFLRWRKETTRKTLPIKQAYCFNDEIKVLTDNNNTIKLIMSLVWLFVIDVIQKQQQIKIFPVQKVLCTDNKADVLIEGKNGSRTWYPIELKYKCTTKDK